MGHSGGLTRYFARPYTQAIDTQVCQIPVMPEGGVVGLDIDRCINFKLLSLITFKK